MGMTPVACASCSGGWHRQTILGRGTDGVIGHIVRFVIVLCSLNFVCSVERSVGRFQHLIKTGVGGHFGGRSVLQLHVLQTSPLNFTIFTPCVLAQQRGRVIVLSVSRFVCLLPRALAHKG